jgi:hypothetical protein
VDDRIASAFPGRVGQRVIRPDDSANVEHSEEENQEHREDQGELDEALAARSMMQGLHRQRPWMMLKVFEL